MLETFGIILMMVALILFVFCGAIIHWMYLEMKDAFRRWLDQD